MGDSSINLIFGSLYISSFSLGPGPACTHSFADLIPYPAGPPGAALQGGWESNLAGGWWHVCTRHKPGNDSCSASSRLALTSWG